MGSGGRRGRRRRLRRRGGPGRPGSRPTWTPATGLADAATAGGFAPGTAELRARLENLPFL
ncbi:hypothetical protein ACFQFC_01135 [Amorphoplanes digitatis]|uniref:hypothetical protein n=1 Tax=Actinoplanes digitatis TaxID=1868 RepID=UPI003615720F